VAARRVAVPVGVPAGVLAVCVGLMRVQVWLASRGPRLDQSPPLRVPLVVGTGPPLELVVLGDSSGAGVGAPLLEGPGPLVAAHLGERFTVTLTNYAVSGARSADVRAGQLGPAADRRPDVALLAVGGNDATHLTPLRRLDRDLRAVIAGLKAANPSVHILCTGSPDVGAVPILHPPLRWLLASRARAVNRVFEAVASEMGAVFVPIARLCGPAFRADRSLFCADGFHPSPAGYRVAVAEVCAVLDRCLEAGGQQEASCVWL
jgi:lysophospholipase L1-like esterase